MNGKTLLFEEFQSEIEELKNIQMGTEEYKICVDGVTKLADRLIEMQKLEDERKEKAIDRDIDMDMKLRQMKEDRKARWTRDAIAIGTFLGSAAICIWGTVGTWRFDAENTPTSTNGRTFLNGLYPKCLKL